MGLYSPKFAQFVKCQEILKGNEIAIQCMYWSSHKRIFVTFVQSKLDSKDERSLLSNFIDEFLNPFLQKTADCEENMNVKMKFERFKTDDRCVYKEVI